MCLIKDLELVVCSHPTCLRAKQNSDFFTHTKGSIFQRRGDFNKVRLHRNAEGKPTYLCPVNPHTKNTDTWGLFSKFQESCTFKVTGNWPRKSVLNKTEIDIQYFLYARRIQGAYNDLKEEYDFTIIIDVEDAAVYTGREL
jgi:hypothetical protein